MRKLALTLVTTLALFAQAGCASDTPEAVPDAGGGKANGYQPLEPEDNQDEIDREIVEQLQENHYNKVTLDDDFSEKFFNAYIDELDGTRGVFLESDIERLRDKYEHALDDELKEGETRAAFDIYNTYQKRRIQIDQWALDRIEQGIDHAHVVNPHQCSQRRRSDLPGGIGQRFDSTYETGLTGDLAECCDGEGAQRYIPVISQCQ